MALPDEKDGETVEEMAGIEVDAMLADEDASVPGDADEPAPEMEERPAEDAEPDATPEGTAEAGDDDDDTPLPPDLMDIFEGEDMVEPTIVIPGLEHLTMNEVASETESVLEELKSRHLS